MLSVNSSHSVHTEAPFGGYKRSGIGREMGMHAVNLYTEVGERLLLGGVAGPKGRNAFVPCDALGVRGASSARSSVPTSAGVL